MSEWFRTLDDDQWLKPDSTGEAEATTVWDALRLSPGMTLLDVPCGAGRVAYHLARRGVIVTGIDLRTAFLNRARDRFIGAGLHGQFIAMDMRAIEFAQAFDGICNWQGSFGYFSDRENNAFLTRLSNALRPNGRIVIDQPYRDYEIANLVPEYSTGNTIVRTRFDFGRSVRITEREVEGRGKPNTSELRLYSRPEMEAMFAECGLRIGQTLGGYTGEEFGPGSKRLICVGVRSD